VVGSSVVTPPAATTGSYPSPLGTQYLIELTEPAKQSEGGIWLPDNWVANWTDGLVLAAGPGLAVDDWRTKMWARVGDRVLFQRHDYRPWSEGYRLGMVKQESLIAVMRGPDHETLRPLNDWVLIEQFPDVETAGVIVLAEEYRPKPMRGRVIAWGPGKVRTTGDRELYGQIRSVSDVMNVPGDRIKGMTVYWPPTCEALAIGRSHLEYLLIAAGDLFGYDDDS